MDAGGRATQDAKAEEGSLCGINDRLSTKITKRAREKWISGGALKWRIKHDKHPVITIPTQRASTLPRWYTHQHLN
jgi:hypothetical protein